MSSSYQSNPWFELRRPLPRARLRLFCFPYAGGSASIYNDWVDAFPSSIEVIAVQYPGRGSRLKDPLIASCDDLVDVLMPQVIPLIDKPFSFFGHSNGALIAFELARKLQETGHRQWQHHFFSAKRAIHLQSKREVLHTLPDAELMKELEALGGTPGELLEDSGIMSYLLPILRADLSLSETFVYKTSAPLRASASLLCGQLDSSVPMLDVLRWSELCTGPVDWRVFEAGHFFINSHRRDVMSFVSDRLIRLLGLQEPSLHMIGRQDSRVH